MTTIDFPEARGIVVCGDIHGEFDVLMKKCFKEYALTDTLIIVAGDCGLGFEEQNYYEDIYKCHRATLSKHNSWIVMMRGNHDNPAYFSKRLICHKRFQTIPDYTVLTACAHQILCVGGAISVDRTYRIASRFYAMPKPDKPLLPNVYWHDESPVFDFDLLRQVTDAYSIDTVVTHTAPSFCELISKTGIESWAAQDRTLLFDVEGERKTMDSLYEYLRTARQPLRAWFYGHFHQSWHSELNGTLFRMLDIMELGEVH